MTYRQLQPSKIVDTIAMLERRIGERFPGSSLSKLAHDLNQIAQEATRRAERIRQPNIGLRIVVAGLLASIFGLFGVIATQLKLNDELFELEHFVTSFEATASAAVLVGAAIVFVITLELRIKRGRALRAIHELRALAHIVDMHQLTKDPERITGRGANTASSPERTMTPFELGRYLDYCSELLSLLSKTGAIYVQEFADPVAIEAVDRLAALTNDLSRNIWQKIMILETIVGPEPASPAHLGAVKDMPPSATESS